MGTAFLTFHRTGCCASQVDGYAYGHAPIVAISCIYMRIFERE
jgi:hypothetical protein